MRAWGCLWCLLVMPNDVADASDCLVSGWEVAATDVVLAFSISFAPSFFAHKQRSLDVHIYIYRYEP